MDFNFHRKLRGKPISEPDLDILLALASAAQATSPTARAQARVAESISGGSGCDARIALFGAPTGRSDGAQPIHRFALISTETFARCQ